MTNLYQFPRQTIGTLVEKISNPVSVQANTMYQQIGIRSHGRGLFDKEHVTGESLGNKRVFWVEPDCFVVNIVFAWEQAVGRTTQGDVGKIASHRFPMYRPLEGKLDLNYLVYFFKTSYGKHLLGLASPGGAGRNKTLGQSNFLELEIPLPSIEEQRRIAEVLGTWDRSIEIAENLIAASEAQKKALMQQILTGKKRLPGFEGGWRSHSFGDVFKLANDKSTQVKKSEYEESGNIPIVDQGAGLISGYATNGPAYEKVPVIVFGDHTRLLKWVDFVFRPGADGTQILKVTDKFDLEFCYFLLEQTPLPNMGYSRHMRALKDSTFVCPQSTSEQKSIARVLRACDREIKLLRGKLQILQTEKAALLQQLLTGKRRVEIKETAA